MKVEVDIKDIKELEKNILKLIDVTGKTVQDVLKQQGTLLAVDLAGAHDRSASGKLSAADGKRHKEDVVQTVLSTYRDASKAAKYFTGYGADAPKRWLGYLKRKEVKKMQAMADKLRLSKAYGGRKIKVQVWDRGAAHTRRLKGTGAKNVVNLVIDYKEVLKFAKLKEQNVDKTSAEQNTAGQRRLECLHAREDRQAQFPESRPISREANTQAKASVVSRAGQRKRF
jgi:hypothetical protein